MAAPKHASAKTRPSDATPCLRELQTAFADNIFNPEAVSILPHLAPGRFAPARHMQVYRNNVCASLTAALQAVFPVVARLVGEGFFDYAAREFIQRHPPRGGNLHDFGVELPDFLADFEPAASLVYLPDTARLEWAYHEAYHAADGTPLSLEKLAAVPAAQYAQLRFQLQPAARLLASEYPILKIWQVNQPDHPDDAGVDLSEGGVRVLVARHDFELRLESLSAGEYALLQSFETGATFEHACDAAFAAEPEFDLHGVLQRHVRRGPLADVR